MDQRAVLVVCAALTGLGVSAAEKQKPNVLLIITDEQQWQCLGANGNPIIKTPNLDKLASQGINYSNMYVVAYPSSPSRACLLSGLYPNDNGVVVNDVVMPAFVPTMGTIFRDAGYHTAWLGKMHLGAYHDPASKSAFVSWKDQKAVLTSAQPGEYAPGENDPQLGFNHWVSPQKDYIAYLQETEVWARIPNAKVRVKGSHTNAPVVDKEIHAGYSDVPEEHVIETFLISKAIEFLKEKEGNPFCMGVSLPAPHSPYTPPKPWDTMYKPEDMVLPLNWNLPSDKMPSFPGNHGNYKGGVWSADQFKSHMAHIYGYVSYVDQQVGRLLDYLSQSGLDKNTIVIFTADHGNAVASHGFITKVYAAWEELLKVPFLIRLPEGMGAKQRGRIVHSYATLIDILPTLLELASLEAPEKLAGRSLADELRGRAKKDNNCIITFVKTELGRDRGGECRMIRQGDWKLVTWSINRADWELYDLKNDPWEMSNLCADPAQAKRVEAMKKLLDEKTESRTKPSWVKNS